MKAFLWNFLIHLLEALNQTLYPRRPSRRRDPNLPPKPIRWKLLLIRLLANWIRYEQRSQSCESFSERERKDKSKPSERSRTSDDSFPTSLPKGSPNPSEADGTEESH